MFNCMVCSAADHNDPNAINSIFADISRSGADLYDLFGFPSDDKTGGEKVVVALTFLLTQKLFGIPEAWLAALMTLGADLLWKFSVSGQSTLLLLVIFLGLAWCLTKIEELGRSHQPAVRKLFLLAIVAGALTGAGMLTRGCGGA